MARPSRTGGKTSEAKARNASPAKGRKTTKTKPRIAPAATRVKRRSASDPSKDLKEAREQQAATAEILKVIASSPSDVQPVFDAIVASADRLIGGFSTAVYRFSTASFIWRHSPRSTRLRTKCLKGRFPRSGDEMPRRSEMVTSASELHDRAIPRQKPMRFPQRSWRGCAVGAARLPFLDARGEADWRHHRHARRAGSFRRSPCPAAADLRRPSRDRDRECTAVR